MLKLKEDKNAKVTPINYLNSLYDSISILNGSVSIITPIVHIKKQRISCFEDNSPIVKKDIIDVMNGLFIIRIVLLVEMNSTAKIYSMNPKHEPNILIHAYVATSLSILKGEL